LGLRIGFYDRKKEPRNLKVREGASIPWGIKTAIKKLGRVPDIIYHQGDLGKEPMIIMLGRDPVEIVMQSIKIGKKLNTL
jgi:hydroxymethylpyrimidine/phosphomethylpyrimidine kinase